MAESGPRSVCLFLSHFWPVASGAENQAYAQGVELVRRGYTVHVLTRSVPGRPSDELRDGLRIHRWIRPIAFGPLFGAGFLFQGARALVRLADQIDLVHTHQGLWEAAAAGLARKRLARPVLVQPAAGGYDGEVETLGRTRGRAVLRRLILRNDHFAAISRQIFEELRTLGVPEGQITLTGSGVDTQRFSPGRSGVKEQLLPSPRVLFAGRLHPQKNLEVLLQAWHGLMCGEPGSGVLAAGTGAVQPARLENRGVEEPGRDHEEQTSSQGVCDESSSGNAGSPRQNPSLIIAGDGPQREQLERVVGELALDESVQFLGAVDDVVEYLRAADMFVLPSRAEGSPNALLEAMSVGVPCVVSAIGGNTDLIEDGASGWVVPVDDANRWCQAIRDVLEDPAEAQRRAAAARGWIIRERALTKVVDQYETVYRLLFRPQS